MIRPYTTFLLIAVAATTKTRVYGQTPAPVSSMSSPTVAPDRCNICGFGNSLTNPTAIVTFIDHAFQETSLSCGDLQQIVNAEGTPYPISFCGKLRAVAIGGGCGCVSSDGTAVTNPPTLFPTPAITTMEPTYPEGTTVLAPSLAPAIVTPTVPPGGSCNLCGADGNTIGSPDASFTVSDNDGNTKTLGCQKAQDLLDTGDAPAGWCELVQVAATEPCTCLDSSGSPIQAGPTISPGDRDCWICGKTDGVANIMGDSNAVVDYIDHEDVLRKFPCKELARLAMDTIVVPLYYCESVMEQSLIPCRCTTPEGDLVSDLMYPTFSPANGGAPATPHSSGGGTDGDGNGNEDGGDGPTPSNSSNSGSGSSGSASWRNHRREMSAILLAVPLAFLL